MTTSLKLCTLNTKGLNNRTKRDQLIMWMKNKSFDIIFYRKFIINFQKKTILNGPITGMDKCF